MPMARLAVLLILSLLLPHFVLRWWRTARPQRPADAAIDAARTSRSPCRAILIRNANDGQKGHLDALRDADLRLAGRQNGRGDEAIPRHRHAVVGEARLGPT